ncbi:MAG: tRNA-dihydrouridine synthase [Chlamydiia bacterium]|nr:tRNA-dihydrouridine synthase [Chlamydiia bacterium]
MQLGSLTLPSNILYAPLAGCSDYPFRKMSSQYGAGIVYCEMVKMDALIRNDPGTFHLLDFTPGMHPIGGQICGSKPEIAGQAAKIIEDLGFDVVDLNCGCPVDKVTKDGSGSGMLKNPDLVGEIISNMVAAVRIPVTVKIRAGWDEETLVAEQIASIAEKAGAQAITVHGRTRQQGYKGPANWDWIRATKQAAKKIKVIGNGDIFSPEDALRMLEYTGCDGVLIARGTLGEPWIAEDVQRLIEGHKAPIRTVNERRLALLQHLEYIYEYLPDRKVVIDMRRVGCWYFKKSKGTKAFREAITKAATIQEIRTLVREFPLEEPEEGAGSFLDINQ